ncbi:hypothetical protein FDECE_2154 [Fusarium decemcellulare]|nr:hypothetical protein FDECE_2154 [Fusarium decemcellulare]
MAVNAADLLVGWSDSNRTSIISVSHEVIITQDNTQQLEREGCPKLDRYLTPDRDLTVIPEGDDLALLPRRSFVYSLKDAKFVPDNVKFLKSLHWRDDGFNQLQLQESHKQVIQSSVRSHLKRNSNQRQIERDNSGTLFTQDFAQGKGRGLLIMLHGEPGTGKISTAEAVAQRFRRPLLPLSCGDMNHPVYAERQLETVFRLSTLWDCILLLDEADVMLSTRTSMDDLFRNSLVSVFLRRLEYYNGILFLTTNRIGKIDQAISSRLHLILHYKRLKQPEIEKAGANNEQPLVVVESDIFQLVSDHCAKHPAGKGAWNGRRIRNAFLIAAGMARDEAEQQESPSFQPQLRGSHFRQVEKLFEEYVQFRMRVLGKDDAQQALLNEERDDDFDGIPDEKKKPTWPAAGGHSQVDQQAQRMMSLSQGHFVKPATPRQHPGMGAGFTMSPYGHEPQPPTTWGMNVNSNRTYAATPPGISIEQAQNVGRPSSMSVQNDSGQNPRPGGQNMGGYGQQKAPGPAMLMNNDQGVQYNATAQPSGGFRQHSFTPDERIGEFPAQNPLDNTGSSSQRF